VIKASPFFYAPSLGSNRSFRDSEGLKVDLISNTWSIRDNYDRLSVLLVGRNR
jgi:hypothetical protein